MKKEYIVLIVLIGALSAYLLLHKENRGNYTLPEIQQMETGRITSILIERSDGPVELNRDGKEWTAGKEKYPVDISLAEALLDTLKTFRLSVLVSEKEDFKRYELDEESRIKVNVVMDDDKNFEFFIGKIAPTMNHTYVMLANDKNVYQANGSFRNSFDRDIDGFRNKKVLEIKPAAVKHLRVTMGDMSKPVTALESETDGDETVQTWQTAEGKPADKEKVSHFLGAISYLTCDTYAVDKTKNDFKTATPLISLEIDAPDPIDFNLYTSDGDDIIYGISSTNDYLFTLSDFDAKEIISGVETLLGIEKKED